MKEVFKEITGFEGLYEVSNLGRIKSLRRCVKSPRGVRLIEERILRGSLGNYHIIQLSKKGKMKAFSVHSIVMKVFIGDRPTGFQINHIDGNRLNNALSNLEYCTCQENVDHAISTGLINNNGENSGKAKLKTEQVIEIKRVLKYTPFFIGMIKMLSEKYKVSAGTIGHIKRNATWKHVIV